MEKFTLPDGKEIDVRRDHIAGIAEEILLPIDSLAGLLSTDDEQETVNRSATADLLEKLHDTAIDSIYAKYGEIEEKLGGTVYALYSASYHPTIRFGSLVGVEIGHPSEKASANPDGEEAGNGKA